MNIQMKKSIHIKGQLLYAENQDNFRIKRWIFTKIRNKILRVLVIALLVWLPIAVNAQLTLPEIPSNSELASRFELSTEMVFRVKVGETYLPGGAIIAYINGEIRGAQTASVIFPPTGIKVYKIMVFNDKTGDNISFKFYDILANKIYGIDAEIEFIPNRVPDYVNPFILNTFDQVTGIPLKSRLKTPVNNATDISINTYLSWDTTEGATSYGLQVSLSSDFASTILNQEGIMENPFLLSNLEINKTYYWRVNATNANGTGEWSNTWSFTTTSDADALPSIPTLPSPPSDYLCYGNFISLYWSTASRATSYNLQVSLSPDFTTTFVSQSISTTTFYLGNLSQNSTYYWRVSATNANGTSPWSNTWHFYTWLPKPTLIAPVNNATDISDNPTLSWNSVEGATSYTLNIFAPGINPIVQTLTNTSFSLTNLAYLTTYSWNVIASNANSKSGQSDTYYFTVYDGRLPRPPDLVFPPNNSTDITLNPVMKCKHYAKLPLFNLQVSLSPDFTTTVINQSNITPIEEAYQTYSLPYSFPNLIRNTTYYWRVSATNTNGVGDWSDTWKFITTDAPPPIPSLGNPMNGDQFVSIAEGYFSWFSIGASYYHLQVSLNPEFTTIVVDQSVERGFLPLKYCLSYNTTYYWRVTATNPLGTSDWSQTRTLRTVSGKQTLLTPVDNATDISIFPTLSWNNFPCNYYHLQFSLNPDFSEEFIPVQAEESTYSFRNLQPNTRYYWRVRAYSHYYVQESEHFFNLIIDPRNDWSDTWSFTTTSDADALPSMPTPSSPHTDYLCYGNFVRLDWSTASRATSYNLQVSQSPDFTTTFVSQSISTTTFYLDNLSHNSIYYWRVSATNTNGTSPWSGSWHFHTSLSKPTLIAPVNNATSITINPTLSWNALEGATSYTLRVFISGESSGGIFQEHLTSTSFPLSNLRYNTRYSWNIVAENNTSYSGTSDTWNFTTEVELPAPPTANNQTECEKSPIQTLTASATAPEGSVVVWFNSASEGEIVANPILNTVGKVTYYAASHDINSHYYSLTRTPVSLTIDGAPSAPTAINATVTYNGLSQTTGATVPPGLSIVWYDAEAGGNVTTQPAGKDYGTYTAYAEAVDNVSGCTSLSRTPVTLTIENAMLVVTAENISSQYSDPLKDLTYEISGFVNGENRSLVTGFPDISTTATQFSAPGEYPISINLSSGLSASNYSFSFVSGIYTITCEDAVVTYNGDNYFTANPNNGSGTVTLSAFVVNAPDGSGGDIRNSTVTFHDVSISSQTLGTENIPVGLVNTNLANGGFASTNHTYTLTTSDINAGGKAWEVWTTVNNYYCGQTLTFAPVILGMPGPEYVTGGGHIVLTSNASGQYSGISGSKMHFGLIMKWNKSGKNLNGRVNITYSGTDGYNYQIKSNSINSLVVSEITDAGKTFKVASITTKANLNRILPDGTFISIGGNLTLAVKVWDAKNDNGGSYDRISIQLSGKSGSGIYFSTNWSSSNGSTIWQNLKGGNINVGVANNTKSLQASEFGIKAYPNPFNDKVYFDLQLKTDSKVRLEIYDINGSKIATVYDDMVVAYDRCRFEYTPKNFSTGTLVYRLIVDGQLMFTGKLIHY
jgi:hypothetical protein